MASNNIQILGFRTQNTWYSSDVIILSESVMKIYNSFLSVRKYEELQENYYKSYFNNLKRYEKYFLNFPISNRYYDLYRRWIELYEEYLLETRKISPDIGTTFPSPPPFPFPFQQLPILQVKTNLLDIFHNLDNYVFEDEHIRIFKIKIGSDGGFSFTGIGEIVKEIRELIKDLWYRNKQEKAKGKIDIIDQYLTVKQKHQNNNEINLGPINSEKELIKNIDEGVKNIKMLEEKKKLKNVPENLEYVEKE